MFSLFNKDHSEKCIVLDVQSGLVSATLVDFNEGNQPKLIAVSTKLIPHATVPVNSKVISERIIKLAAETVAEVIAKGGHHGISDIHYVFSSPWLLTELKTIKIDYIKDTTITSKTIDKIIREEIAKNPLPTNAYPVEQKIFEIKLNGYAVNKFEGKSAKSLEICLSISLGTKDFFEKIHETIFSVAHIKKHSYHSSLILIYTSLREMLDTIQEYIFIHVHDELTDIVIVKNGLCKNISSFPFGVNTLLRRMAEISQCGIESCESLLSLYHGDKLNDPEKLKADKVVDPLLKEWGQLCIDSFNNSFDAMHMPRTVFISTNGHFDLFKNALLFKNEFNFEVFQYEDVLEQNPSSATDFSSHSTLMKMYILALSTMV